MLGSIKKLFNKLGFKHHHYEPPAKPRWTVIQLEGGGFLYYQYKPVGCPDVLWYQFTGDSIHKGRYRKVAVKDWAKRITLFNGYLAETNGLTAYHSND